MFADLLLALMVIFLAAQSFVPKEANLPAFAGLLSNKTNLHGKIEKFTTSITLTSPDEAKLVDALQHYGALAGLPSDFVIESMVVAGGFNPKTESSDRGTSTALNYAATIAGYNLPYFKNTATLLAASSDVPDGDVILNISIAKTPAVGSGATATPAPSSSTAHK